MKKSNKINNYNLVMESRPDKNILYYFDDYQYSLFNRTMENWNTTLLGKFSVSKCMKYLIDLDEFYDLGYKFDKVKIEEKELDINKKLKGMTGNYIHIDDYTLYDRFINKDGK